MYVFRYYELAFFLHTIFCLFFVCNLLIKPQASKLYTRVHIAYIYLKYECLGLKKPNKLVNNFLGLIKINLTCTHVFSFFSFFLFCFVFSLICKMSLMIW